jgi:uncharacterized protein YjbI with pentapeptide repeats
MSDPLSSRANVIEGIKVSKVAGHAFLLRRLRFTDRIAQAVLPFAVFADAHMPGADLTNATVTQSNWQRAVATDVSFQSADLARANFAHADLSAATFASAKLNHARLHAVNDEGTDWADADVTGATDTDHARLAAEEWTIPD